MTMSSTYLPTYQVLSSEHSDAPSPLSAPPRFEECAVVDLRIWRVGIASHKWRMVTLYVPIQSNQLLCSQKVGSSLLQLFNRPRIGYDTDQHNTHAHTHTISISQVSYTLLINKTYHITYLNPWAISCLAFTGPIPQIPPNTFRIPSAGSLRKLSSFWREPVSNIS